MIGCYNNRFNSLSVFLILNVGVCLSFQPPSIVTKTTQLPKVSISSTTNGNGVTTRLYGSNTNDNVAMSVGGIGGIGVNGIVSPIGFLSGLFSPPDSNANKAKIKDDPYAIGAYNDWRAYLDTDTTGMIYYYNVVTQQSQWNAPSGFPPIQLTTKERKLSKALQSSYNEKLIENTQGQFSTNSGAKWFLGTMNQITDIISSNVGNVISAASNQMIIPQEPLAREGPWSAYVDHSSNKNKVGTVYYFNELTGQSQWEPPTTTFPTIRSSPSKQVVASVASKSGKSNSSTSVTTNTDELIGEYQDWLAYFDSTDSCLIYYTNKQTGISQWEQPIGFPTPTLSNEQIARMQAKKQQVQAAANFAATVTTWNIIEKLLQIFITIFTFMIKLFEIALDKVLKNGGKNSTNTDNDIDDNENDDLFEKTHYRVTKRKCSTTHSVMQSLQEKRSYDSVKRQKNLRKNYKAVNIDHRSPTISLTALKNKHEKDGSKDWLKYLND